MGDVERWARRASRVEVSGESVAVVDLAAGRQDCP